MNRGDEDRDGNQDFDRPLRQVQPAHAADEQGQRMAQRERRHDLEQLHEAALEAAERPPSLPCREQRRGQQQHEEKE